MTLLFSRVLDEHGLQARKFKRVNYPTETLTSGNERQAYSVHQSLYNTQNPAPNNQFKNQIDKSTSISTSSPLFLRLPHPLQGRQITAARSIYSTATGACRRHSLHDRPAASAQSLLSASRNHNIAAAPVRRRDKTVRCTDAAGRAAIVRAGAARRRGKSCDIRHAVRRHASVLPAPAFLLANNSVRRREACRTETPVPAPGVR